MQYPLYILWHYISLVDDTSISYVRKSVKSRRILTQSRLSVVKMGWRVGTIARQLGVHHSTVERVLGEAGVQRERRRPRRPSKLDPYLAFITETLEHFPTLTAARVFDMVKARGYTGGPDHFRHRIAELRPRRVREAYLRLRTLPGEQAQVDWAHFGKITIGRAERPLMAFVLVLSYSRYPFVRSCAAMSRRSTPWEAV